MDCHLFRIPALIAVVLLSQVAAAQRAEPGAVLGRIVLPDGSPVANTRVAALTADPASSNDALVNLTQTDRNGRYRLEGLSPGRYYLIVGQLDAPVYFPGASSKADAAIVTVAAGLTLADHDFHLKGPLALRVSGHVVPKPQPDGERIILVGGKPPSPSARIASDGSFEFANVRPGPYQLFVTPDLDALAPRELVVADKDIVGLEVFVPPSGEAEVDVPITVAVEGGAELIPTFELKFTPIGRIHRNFPSDGVATPVPLHVSQQLPLGEYKVTLGTDQLLPPGYSVKTLTAGATDLLMAPLNLTGSGVSIAITLAVSSPPPWVKVSGKVADIGQSTVRPEQITIRTNSLASPITTSVSADGSFEFPMVLPGFYGVKLMPPPDLFFRVLKVGTTDLSNVEIPMVIPAFKVSGRVENLPTVFRGVSLLVALSPVALTARIAADGSFVFDAVQAGNYMLTLMQCGELCSSEETGLSVTVIDKEVSGLVTGFGPQ